MNVILLVDMGFPVVISYPQMAMQFLWIALGHSGDLIIGTKVLKFYFMLILELITNIEDARLTVYRPDQCPVNNISLCDIAHASQTNNAISFTNRLCNQLNDVE